MHLIPAYVRWTRRQGSVLNCGHVVVLAAAAVVLAVLALASGGAAALAVTAVLVFTACAAAVAYGAWRLARPARAVRRAPEPELAADHCLPRDLPAPAWPVPDWSPAAAQLPAAADNAAPSDPGTAEDLAAVLARARVRP